MIYIFKNVISPIWKQKQNLCLGVLICLCLFGLMHTDSFAQDRGQMEVVERDEETGRATKVNFNFTSQDIKNVLEWLSRETDLTIIATEDDIRNKRFSLINLFDVTIEEVIEEVKTVLAQYNLTLVRRNSTLIVTTFDKAIIMTGPVKRITPDPDQVELTDEIQTYIIQLQNASAEEQVNALKPLLNNKANIFADKVTNALVITDVSSSVHRIVSILQFADAGERFPLKIAVIPLTSADAQAVAQTLNRVFEDNREDTKPIRGDIGIDPEQIKEAIEEGTGVELIEGMIRVYADTNSNTLILKASEDNLVIVKEIITHLDNAPSLQTEIRTYRLKYASAEEVVTTLEEIITGNNIQGGRRSFDREDILEMLTYRRNEVRTGDLFQGIIGLVNLSRNDRLNVVVVSSDPRNFTIIEKLINELDQKKTSEEIKMYFLKHANAEDMSTNLQELFEGDTGGDEYDRYRPWWDRDRGDDSSGGGFGVQGEVHIVFDVRLNALIITTATQNFPMIDELVAKLDVSMPEQEWGTRIFNLKYADANNVAELLNSHYGGNQSNTGNRFDDWWWIRSRQSTTATSAQTQGSLAGNVTAQPYSNLNAVIVSTGTKRNFDLIEEFIGQIDVPTPPNQVEITKTIRLEYATADAIAQILSQVWQGREQEDEGGFGFSRFIQDTFNDEPTDINSLFGKVTVFAETDTNSLIVTTRRRYMEQVEALIKKLDFVRGQVWIDIKILEVTLDEKTKLGIEATVNERNLGGIELNSRNPLIGDAESKLGLDQEISGFNYSLATKEYMALLHTLMRENKVKTLSTPSLLTRDSRPATWSSGRRIPYLQSVDTNSILGDTATQPLFNYDFIDPPVGINISLTPYIARSKAGEDGKRTIGLDITNISASNFIEFTEFNAPITDDNTLSVYIDVEDGQQLVVGGIIRKKQKEVENKVPILGDIPLLGRLFKSTETEVQDTEIVFIITPHIVDIQNPLDIEKLKQKSDNWQKNGRNGFEKIEEPLKE